MTYRLERKRKMMDYDSTDSTQETVMDVVAEMKGEAFDLDWNESCARICGMLLAWSDRIEAAAKRCCYKCV